jgi:hypothetical protein
MQVPFELIFKSDRANDDVQLITKFRRSKMHADDKGKGSHGTGIEHPCPGTQATHLDQDPHFLYQVIVLILINDRAPC